MAAFFPTFHYEFERRLFTPSDLDDFHLPNPSTARASRSDLKLTSSKWPRPTTSCTKPGHALRKTSRRILDLLLTLDNLVPDPPLANLTFQRANVHIRPPSGLVWLSISGRAGSYQHLRPVEPSLHGSRVQPCASAARAESKIHTQYWGEGHIGRFTFCMVPLAHGQHAGWTQGPKGFFDHPDRRPDVVSDHAKCRRII